MSWDDLLNQILCIPVLWLHYFLWQKKKKRKGARLTEDVESVFHSKGWDNHGTSALLEPKWSLDLSDISIPVNTSAFDRPAHTFANVLSALWCFAMQSCKEQRNQNQKDYTKGFKVSLIPPFCPSLSISLSSQWLQSFKQVGKKDQFVAWH